MSDERRIECAAKWLAFADGTTDAEVARKFLTELDAVGPLRQTRGDAVEAAYQAYEEFMSIDRSLNECTTKEILTLALPRALNAALAVIGRSEAPDPPFPTWGPEMAALVLALGGRAMLSEPDQREYFHGLLRAAFPDPAREGSPDVQ